MYFYTFISYVFFYILYLCLKIDIISIQILSVCKNYLIYSKYVLYQYLYTIMFSVSIQNMINQCTNRFLFLELLPIESFIMIIDNKNRTLSIEILSF